MGFGPKYIGYRALVYTYNFTNFAILWTILRLTLISPHYLPGILRDHGETKGRQRGRQNPLSREKSGDIIGWKRSAYLRKDLFKP